MEDIEDMFKNDDGTLDDTNQRVVKKKVVRKNANGNKKPEDKSQD